MNLLFVTVVYYWARSHVIKIIQNDKADDCQVDWFLPVLGERCPIWPSSGSYKVSCWVIKGRSICTANPTCRNGTLATTLHVGVGWSWHAWHKYSIWVHFSPLNNEKPLKWFSILLTSKLDPTTCSHPVHPLISDFVIVMILSCCNTR